ncbi:MAG: YaeQ family protein [Duodenibacillus sp.]|nr:YaeQ family protein [Duodenibacillus sp.]
MALGATIYKVTLDVSDLDRGYYATHSLAVAQHPSETVSRLMLRILTFALYAGEHVKFGRGLSTEGDAAIWEINDAGDIGRWIELGVPEVKLVRRAAGRSEDVVVMAYDETRIGPWWAARKGDLSKVDKLTVRWISDEHLAKLAEIAQRSMRLAVTIQDGMVWLADGKNNLEIEIQTLMRRGEPVF